MTVFKNLVHPEFGELRTVEIDGEPWFVGKDVAAALGYTNSRDAIATHVFADDKGGVESIDTLGGRQKMTIINESGLYALVNNPVPVSLLSGDRKPQIRFLGNHHSGSGNLYHKSFRM